MIIENNFGIIGECFLVGMWIGVHYLEQKRVCRALTTSSDV